MNPIVLQFANGNIFFVGLGLVVGALALSMFSNGPFVRSLLTITSVVGIILVILSATPLPPWLYGLWLGFCFTGLILGNAKVSTGSWHRRLLFGASAFASLILMFVELPYHLAPVISVSPNRHVYVVGDSISAGITAKERAWPAVLGELAHMKVTNLARPGATAESALTQSSKITEQGCLIIVEIGGNDLLGGTESRAFYIQLDQLLGKLCSPDNQVIMLEIPLFPFGNAFGRAQRILARKHGVTLLPKKFLTNVFGLQDATSDGLHFSQLGHEAMAKEIYGVLSFE